MCDLFILNFEKCEDEFMQESLRVEVACQSEAGAPFNNQKSNKMQEQV
jgi:hypothetical protein